jgi:O-antigen biosynthesis protein
VSALGRAPFLRRQNALVEDARLRQSVRLAELSSKLDSVDRRRQQLEKERREQGSAKLENRIGALLEELDIARAAAQRLQADVERAVERERELVGRLEAMRAELTSGRGLGPGEAMPRLRPDPEAELRDTLGRRYGPISEGFAELGPNGANAFMLSQDAAGVLTGEGGRGGRDESVDVVVCIHNATHDVRRCLRALLDAGGHPFHLILIDDGSNAATRRLLRWFAAKHPSVELIRKGKPPHGYTIAANLGLRASTADYVVLLNSDTVVTPGWLDALVELWGEDDDVGVVGPLSNAASHQSVPRIKDAGGWATNPLPDSLNPDAVGFLVGALSDGRMPRVPFVNGFCFGIAREAIEQVGVFDEESFAEGFCEENDFAVRARDAGFSLAVSDRSYVHHAKSASYGSERRDRIAGKHYERFLAKHGKEKVDSLLAEFATADEALKPLRKRIADATSGPGAVERAFREVDGQPLEVSFVLGGMAPGGGGGAHSIYQEARAMRALGVPVRVLIASDHLGRAAETYEEAESVFAGYGSDEELAELTATSDVIVATHHRSVGVVAGLRESRRDFLPAYYVQDYEPFFAADESAISDEALLSYGAMPNLLVFAKTDWLCSVLAANHGIQAAKVRPSLDTGTFNRDGRPEPVPNGPLRLAAMIRPETPRRQPRTTLRLLDLVRRELGARVEIVTFGCSREELEDGGGLPPDIDHLGPLRRPQVADVLRGSDVFVDLSIYQAFGRTGLESMACGCTAMLPEVGGAVEYARDGVNSMLVDTGDLPACLSVIVGLARDRRRLKRLQDKAAKTAAGYSALGAAVSEYVLFRDRHRRSFGPEAEPARAGLGAA